MRACLPGVQTIVQPEGVGPALAIVINQHSSDPGGWVLDVEALFKDMDVTKARIGSITILAPGVNQSCRIVAIATIPGAYGYAINVRGPSATTNPNPIQIGAFCGDMTAFPLTAVHP